MGLFADEMVQVEDLYSNWNYDVPYTLAPLPHHPQEGAENELV